MILECLELIFFTVPQTFSDWPVKWESAGLYISMFSVMLICIFFDFIQHSQN